MKDFTHLYSRYGLALTMQNAEIESADNLKAKDFSDLLAWGLDNFRVKPTQTWQGKPEVPFVFFKEIKGDPSKGIYLSPHVIASDGDASKLWGKVETEFIQELNRGLSDRKVEARKAFAPTTGEYNNGSKTKKAPKISFLEAICCAITTLSRDKPAFAQVTIKDGKPSYSNTTILPDLDLDDLQVFISLFKKIAKIDNLLIGRVSRLEEKTKITEKPLRPNIFNGNFPNAPKSNALSALGLLGAIGEWARESEETNLAREVLKKLEGCPIYIINSDGTRVTSYNHYIVKLAREGRLNSIIDTIFYTNTFPMLQKLKRGATPKETENYKKMIQRERDKVLFFASRFLHLFDEMSFREFLAVRAEYPNQLEILFKTYFMEVKNIDSEIVVSARHLGAWLNKVAYFVARDETKKEPAKLYEEKAKILIQLESSAFSAKTASAFIFQTIRQAGQMSKSDAPNEAELFIEKTLSGEINLDTAKQMLMAFSRLKTKYEKGTQNPLDTEGVEVDSFVDADAQDS